MDLATGKPVASEEESGDLGNSESDISTHQEQRVTVKPIACTIAAGKHHASSTSACQKGPKAGRKTWPHHLQISPDTAHHTEAVFSIVREIYGQESDDPMNDLDVNTAIWGIFLNATLRAAFILDKTMRRI